LCFQLNITSRSEIVRDLRRVLSWATCQLATWVRTQFAPVSSVCVVLYRQKSYNVRKPKQEVKPNA
jgi:hypothetical protein